MTAATLTRHRSVHPLSLFEAPYRWEKPTDSYVARCPRCHVEVASISSEEAVRMRQVGVTSHRDSTENHLCKENEL